MHAENILAIDNGTQSVRAIVFDPRGNLLAKEQVHLPAYSILEQGWSEQDPRVFWNAVCEACLGLWNQEIVSKDSIAAVALTTQRATVINLDKNGDPLRPAMLWMDQRRTEGLPSVKGLWGLAFKISGASKTVSYLQAEAEANWIRTHQKEIWKNTYKYVFLSGYLTYLLTGKFVDSVGCQVGYMPFDYKRQTWAKAWDWKWQAVPMPKDYLPELVPPGDILGVITPEASQATGIPAGLSLIAAAADKACEVIGSGCLEPQIGSLSYGTAATINTTHKKYVEVIPLIPPYPAAVPNRYTLEIQIYRGYWMVNWFMREFGLQENRLAKERGVPTEDLFDNLVRSVPPGSDGLILQPYWSPGLKMPGPEAKGSIIGFTDVHTRAHLYRAILEGIAYALRDGADRTTRRSGVNIEELRVAGGGSQSDAALQLTADIFNLPTARPHVYEASGLGAAVVASVGAGLHSSYDTAVSDMTRVSKWFEPISEHHKIYDDYYQNIYLKMYDKLNPLHKSIHRISRNFSDQ